MIKELLDYKVILASGSPRRATFLSDIDINFEVVTADIDESARQNELALSLVQRLAEEKGKCVFSKLDQNYGNTIIISADTIVYFKDFESKETILGKPVDREDAKSMLRKLSGKTHIVATAFCLIKTNGVEIKNLISKTVETKVFFRDLSNEEIDNYLNTGEADDKAGAYGIQGFASNFVKKIEGSYTNVVGLPMAELVEEIKHLVHDDS